MKENGEPTLGQVLKVAIPILVVCFVTVLFSVNQIILLAQ